MNRFCFNRVWRPQWKTPNQTSLNPPPPPSPSSESHYCLLLNKLYFPWLTHLWLGTHEHAPDFFKLLSFSCSFFLQIGILLFYVNPLLLQERETSNSCPLYITQCIWLIMTLCSSLLLWFFYIQIKNHRLNVTNNHILTLSKRIFISYILKPVSIPTSFWGVSSSKD